MLRILISLSISGSIMAVILLSIKIFIKYKISKSCQYYIWIIAIARYLIPFSVEINIPYINNMQYEISTSYSVEQSYTNSVYIQQNDVDSIEIESSSKNLIQNHNTDYFKYIYDNLILIWLILTLILILKKISNYKNFVKFIKAGRNLVYIESVQTIYLDTCDKMKIEKSPLLYSSEMISSPMLIGITNPFIVIPKQNLNDLKSLKYIFMHELTHYKRYDYIYKWIVQFAVCVHFFNPLIYIVSKEIDSACELSCDESIIRNLNDSDKKLYGDTLLNSAAMNNMNLNHTVSLTLCENAKLLKERLYCIVKFHTMSKFQIFVSISIAFLLCILSIFTYSYRQSYAKSEKPVLNGIDSYALDIMQGTGNWDYVEPLFKYMTADGVGKVVKLYLRKTGDIEKVKQASKYMNESDREFFDYYSTDSKQYFDEEVQNILDSGGSIYDIMILIPYMSSEKVCSILTDYIDRTGEYNVMYNTRQFMDTASIDKVTLHYVNKTYDFEGVSAMLQFMSEDASDYVAQKYFENSEDLTYSYLFKPYLKKEYESRNISSKLDSSSSSSPVDIGLSTVN